MGRSAWSRLISVVRYLVMEDRLLTGASAAGVDPVKGGSWGFLAEEASEVCSETLLAMSSSRLWMTGRHNGSGRKVGEGI